jgi:ATP-dependent DNA helicase RecG
MSPRRDALAGAGLPSAHYVDSGITFTVILSQPAPSGASAPATRDQVIYDALGDNPATVADLESHTGLPGYTIRRSLRDLRARD